MKPTFRSHFLTACRLCLGAVFLWACIDKILNPEDFAHAIANYQIVSPDTANLTALILPWIELVCGVGLIFNRWAQGSALIVAALMVVFMAALGYNIFRGMDVSCGCFTLDEQAPGNMWLYMIRDSVFLILAIIVMRRPHFEPEPVEVN